MHVNLINVGVGLLTVLIGVLVGLRLMGNDEIAWYVPVVLASIVGFVAMVATTDE